MLSSCDELSTRTSFAAATCPTQRPHALAVVNFLRLHGEDEGLRLLSLKPYSLHARRHAELPNLILLHYDQLASSMKNPIVRECRGIVLDAANADSPFLPVSCPYFKFDNYNPSLHKPLLSHAGVWSGCKVYDKLDGSMVNLYYYDGRWRVSTSNCADGGNPVGKRSTATQTFEHLFWDVWAEIGNPDAATLPHDLCFMFELVTPENRVIVPVSRRCLTLHGVRERTSLFLFALN